MTSARKIIIITAPSGAGKTSITQHLLKQFPVLSFSVSAATRSPRGNEKDGVDYYFISEGDFRTKIEAEAFLEWEMVYPGKYYGTLLSEMDRIWDAGRIPVLDIDVQGAMKVQQRFPESCLSLFIQPPSLEELRRRLQRRGTESESGLEARIGKAAYEMSFMSRFDAVVVNDVLETACRDAEAQVAAFLEDDHRPVKP